MSSKYILTFKDDPLKGTEFNNLDDAVSLIAVRAARAYNKPEDYGVAALVILKKIIKTTTTFEEPK